jgi:AraC-like DNA-binding protein
MEKIFYLLERIYRMTHIPTYYFDKNGDITLFNYGYENDANPILSDEVLLKNLVNKASVNQYPILEYEENILYGLCKDSLGNIIILGPVSNSSPISSTFLKHYVYQHKINNENFRFITKTLDELCSALTTLFFLITGEQLREMDIITNTGSSSEIHEAQKSIYQNYVFDYSESEISRFNFSVEMDFMKHIKNGDSDSVRQQKNHNLPSFQEGRVGKLAKKFFKQNEYLACTVIILASRAAIEGGLDSLTSYLMSDLYLQHLENCKNISDIYSLVQEVVISYAERVKLMKENNSQLSYVELSKNYIANNLNKHFTIDDLAKEININKFYLSRLFSDSVGMGIQHYTQMKRIEAASNMLKFSDESILTIANYLCFSTQSHFGKVFRQYTGVTPRVFREKNFVMDFKLGS